MNILLAGGAGYIGSHTAVELLTAGHDVVIVDNYCNSCAEAVNRVEEVSGKKVVSYEADVKDKVAMAKIFAENKIDCVIHFAGLKAVGESVQKPIEYYRNNIDTTLTLLECMKEAGVKKFVFSSSATVYGEENDIPYIETMKRGSCSNPYGWTIGAHESGRMGEDPQGIPNNLMPYIAQVAVGRRDYLTVYGGDYPTKDGTCRRDYIHVMDLANGHLKAVEYAAQHKGVEVFNLGTGTPYSVLEIIHAFESANDIKIKYEIGDRRAGDLPEFWANAEKAEKILGWKTQRTLEDMCRDTWNWQKNNPQGYNK